MASSSSCRGPQPDSYYGKPILKEPVWRSPDVPGYLFLGGLAGASSVLAAFAQAAGNHRQAKASKIAAAGAIGAVRGGAGG